MKKNTVKSMSIKTILCINKFILAVYYTNAKCFQYSIIDEYGTVFNTDDIFYTSEAAESDGRKVIHFA